jgi:transcriptional regulator with XRE-family HTH domain
MRAKLNRKQVKALGENIRSQRDRMLVTQAELARALRVSRPCVALWETGHSAPSLAMFVRVADRLNCSADQLLARL